MSDLYFWSRFSEYDNTVDSDTLLRLMQDNVISHTVQAPCTQRDVVEQVAQRAHTPIVIESVSDLLAEPTFSRGRSIFGTPGKALDDIAQNYPNMHWWLTENGLNMDVIKPLHVRLAERLDEEVEKLPPQARGYAFERFLDVTFSVYGLAPRKSFRLTGEQIDGSFQLDHVTYLVEAKWQDTLVGSHDLYAFRGVIGSKAAWARGLFISFSGFSPDGLEAFERGEKPLICLTGDELRYIFAQGFDMAEVIRMKARHAAETGQIFVQIQDIFSPS